MIGTRIHKFRYEMELRKDPDSIASLEMIGKDDLSIIRSTQRNREEAARIKFERIATNISIIVCKRGGRPTMETAPLFWIGLFVSY